MSEDPALIEEADAATPTVGEQLDLDGLFRRQPNYTPPGRVELGVRAALVAAGLDEQDFGAALTAVELARGMDEAARGPAKGRAYALSAIGKELREQLTRLRLDPAAREGGGADEELTRLVNEWTKTD